MENKVERRVYKIGSRFGISAYMDIETKKVLCVIYESIHEGGVLYSSRDGIEEVSMKAFEEIKRRDIQIFNRIMNIKSGVEDFVRYAWFDKNVQRFVTISDEKFAWEWPSNAAICEIYKSKGYELRPYPLKDNPHEAFLMEFP